MKVLHILTGGQIGGIETLCRELGVYSQVEHGFCFMSFGGNIYEQMTKMGMHTYPLFLRGRKFSMNKMFSLLKIAKDYDVLIIHHEDPFVETYYFWIKILLRKKGIRYVHSCYNDRTQWDENFIKHLIKRITRQITLNISDKVIVVSRVGYDGLLEAYKVKKEKIRIIYNGIADEYIEGGKNSLKCNEHKRIKLLYIGRLVNIKGVDLLINSISRLVNEYDVELSIVGDGVELVSLKNLVKSLNLDDRVIFHGSQTDITGFLNDADIFVYPSICQEIFGISVVEAMAYGKICVTNNVGGLPEIVTDGVNGFITDDITVDALTSTIERAINLMNPENICSYQSLVEAAKATADRFSVSAMCKRFDEEIIRNRSKKILMLVNWKVEYRGYPTTTKQPPDYYVYGEPYWFFRYFNEQPDVDVVDISSFRWLERFEAKGLHFYIWQALRVIPRLKDYDVVISHGMPSGIVVSLWRKFFKGNEKHLVFDIGAFNSAAEKGFAHKIMQYTSRSIDYIIFHTSSQIDYYKKCFSWLVDKSEFIRFGTDYDFWSEKSNRVKLEDNKKPYCICVGYNKRDWDTVVEAYKLANPDNLILRMIGHVDDKYADIQGLEQLGMISVDELTKQIKNAKFCILPLKSYNYSYGQMTLMQQMLMRKCVITAKVPSVVDYVKDGENAVLYEPENVDQLAEKILLINSDVEYRENIAYNAEKFIKEVCNEKTMAAQIEKSIDGML